MKSKLVTANTWFGSMSREPNQNMTFDRYRTTNLRRMRERFKIKEAGFDNESAPVQAIVNHGNWLVRCPGPGCKGAEYAWEEGWYYCASCHNSYIGHKYRRLVFPEDRTRIEELLEVRPLANRNWTPQETVADLEEENNKHAADLLTPAAKGG